MRAPRPASIPVTTSTSMGISFFSCVSSSSPSGNNGDFQGPMSAGLSKTRPRKSSASVGTLSGARNRKATNATIRIGASASAGIPVNTAASVARLTKPTINQNVVPETLARAAAISLETVRLGPELDVRHHGQPERGLYLPWLVDQTAPDLECERDEQPQGQTGDQRPRDHLAWLRLGRLVRHLCWRDHAVAMLEGGLSRVELDARLIDLQLGILVLAHREPNLRA